MYLSDIALVWTAVTSVKPYNFICVICLYIYIKKYKCIFLCRKYDSNDPEETATDDQLVLDDADSDGSQSDTSTDSSDDDI